MNHTKVNTFQNERSTSNDGREFAFSEVTNPEKVVNLNAKERIIEQQRLLTHRQHLQNKIIESSKYQNYEAILELQMKSTQITNSQSVQSI
jgi:hypothetical protein